MSYVNELLELDGFFSLIAFISMNFNLVQY